MEIYYTQERDGWYTTHALERIKAVLRHKFFSLVEGYIATDEECAKLLEQQGESKTTKPITRKLRPGRHNMAKGALPPEDAAVRTFDMRSMPVVHSCCLTLQAMRLRAALNRNARENLGQDR